MMCAWESLMEVLPEWLSNEVDMYGKEALQEIRLRLWQVPELKFQHNSLWLDRIVSGDDLTYIINTASGYSPWSSETLSSGYLTASGGHRIGVCGEAVIKEGVMTGFRQIQSLCIRVARDFPGIFGELSELSGSILLIGPPGSGKTTLLRDLARYIAKSNTVAVIDERAELFPAGIRRGRRMDVLTGCSKIQGLEILVRTMGPEYIAVDEITSKEDCAALIRTCWCGVSLLATAHAASVSDLIQRPVYKPLIASGVFDHILVLGRDKSWREEKVAI